MIYAHAMNAQSSTDPEVAPVLTESQLREMADFGSGRSMAEGELLFRVGEATFDLFVVLEGEVEVMRSDGEVVVRFGPGNFIGELGLLTGQIRFLNARVARAGRVLVIAQDEFRRLMSVRPTLADIIFAALVA